MLLLMVKMSISERKEQGVREPRPTLPPALAEQAYHPSPSFTHGHTNVQHPSTIYREFLGILVENPLIDIFGRILLLYFVDLFSRHCTDY